MKMTWREIVEEKLREKQWNHKDLANATGLSEATLSMLFTGRHNPSLQTAVLIGEVLDMTLEDFDSRNTHTSDFVAYDYDHNPIGIPQISKFSVRK